MNSNIVTSIHVVLFTVDNVTWRACAAVFRISNVWCFKILKVSYLLNLFYQLTPSSTTVFVKSYMYSINPSLHFACAYQVLMYKQYTVQLTLIVTRACMLFFDFSCNSRIYE